MRFYTAASAMLATVYGIQLDLSDPENIKRVASTVAFDMMSFYKGNLSGNAPGLLPNSGQPNGYPWWMGGAMFDALVSYWDYTGDSTYNAVTSQALLHQAGEHNDYEPKNYTVSIGNDDQAFWGMAAMTAAEYKFPNPPPDKPQWLALAQAIFNRQQPRWDNQNCGGGLRWQFLPLNGGYNYKNAISNGCFFNIAARLGKYTGNQTYLDWAERTFLWSQSVGMIDEQYNVFDGTDVTNNCSGMVPYQWTYNNGVYMLGAAAMWNVSASNGNATGAAFWRTRLQGLLDNAAIFFPDEVGNILEEVPCEGQGNCNTDQLSFKAYLARWMANTAVVAPWTYDQIKPRLEISARAAARACVGGNKGTLCGYRWTTGSYDGLNTVSSQMCALDVIQANLLQQVAGPVNVTGGISQGDPTAGAGPWSGSADREYGPVTTGDKAGAGILTAIVFIVLIGGGIWMCLD